MAQSKKLPLPLPGFVLSAADEARIDELLLCGACSSYHEALTKVLAERERSSQMPLLGVAW